MEKFRAQRLVITQIWQQRFVSFRHVEIDGRRNLGEIAHGLLDTAWHRLACIEIHRAAIKERQPDIVVAAKRMIPRQPDNSDRTTERKNPNHIYHHKASKAKP